ncbi:MAG: hypothetical protein OHK93_003042 [Ramalina farinacea]|uniref:Uncharacterized protein n=1 Tax=Ramalina farinacea TaxID=258253 RepID=A0AA43QV60_9LECA|nr:hypothetical protein [Ramalina farinacea]
MTWRQKQNLRKLELSTKVMLKKDSDAELFSPSSEEYITAEREAKSGEQARLKETQEQYRVLDRNMLRKINLTHALESPQEELNRKQAITADIAKEIGKRKLY